MRSTRVERHIRAPREAVFRALVDPRAIAAWKVPDGMTCVVHAFDAREGGRLRISLTYDDPTGDDPTGDDPTGDEPTPTGKTSARTDTYRGRFVRLVPNEQVVEVDEFETDDPSLRGEMTVTITLADEGGGTELVALHEGLPSGLAPDDNETGWRMALARLAALVEAT